MSSKRKYNKYGQLSDAEIRRRLQAYDRALEVNRIRQRRFQRRRRR